MTLKNHQKSEKEWICRFKIGIKNLTNFDSLLKNLKNAHFMGCFWLKYIMFELKKYRGVIFHDSREWCKIWRKNDLPFGKWQEEFGTFSPEHMKVSKLGLSLGPFIKSRKCMSLKFPGKLCVMTMKNNAKFEENLTFKFKIKKRNLINFDSSNIKSKKIAL